MPQPGTPTSTTRGLSVPPKEVGRAIAMLSPFFFRRIDPGICPGLAPGFVSQVLGDGIPGGIPVGHAVVFVKPKPPAKNRPINQAAHVAPALRRASGLSRRLLAPPRWSRLRPAQPSALARSGPSRSVRWSATPPGTACAVQWPARSGAPVRPAPSRHSRRPLRSRRLSRARPVQTGGGPAAPGRLPGPPQPPRKPRRSLTLCAVAAGRRARSRSLRSRLGLRLRSLALPSAGSAWPGSRGARALAPAEPGRRCARSPSTPRPARNASTDAVASPLRLRAALRAAADRCGVKWRSAPAPRHSGRCRSLRVAWRLAPTPRGVASDPLARISAAVAKRPACADAPALRRA